MIDHSQLTARQREILGAFIARRDAGESPPAVRELCKQFGVNSPNGMLCHIKALVKKRALVAGQGIARRWRLPDQEIVAARDIPKGAKIVISNGEAFPVDLPIPFIPADQQ
jgi:repressor LexA